MSRKSLLLLGGAGLALLGALAGATSKLERRTSARPPVVAVPSVTSLPALATAVQATLKRSRLDLLGSRDPKLGTCVTPVLSGQVTDKLPEEMGDYDGGPGTKLAVLLALDRQNCTHVLQDYDYHQGRLRRFLENEFASNGESLAMAEETARKARELSDRLAAATSFPEDLTPTHAGDRDTWPGYCLLAMDQAIADRDLDGVKRWSAELSGATFSLADLHRWLGFLASNHLYALDFQARCKSLFDSAEQQVQNYDRNSTLSQFPAGLMTMHGNANYYEVEHRAERLFTMPADRFEALRQDGKPSLEATWLPPVERAVFAKVRAVLSRENAALWDAAARREFDHTYLVNMLDRAARAGTVDQLVDSVSRFNARNPKSTDQELLGVLMYRGHSFAGVEWSDRFLPQLVAAAKPIAPDADEQAFVQAAMWTKKFYRPESYGVTFSLRDALSQNRLDCVRATDMIGALFRNSGHGKFAHIRWSSETGGHSVAATFIPTGPGTHKTLIEDGLNPSASPEVWPDAYFQGHAWPQGMERFPQPYAAELYVRGLDNYVWAEGYIIRGPNAGTLCKAAIPYFRDRHVASDAKVYNGAPVSP